MSTDENDVTQQRQEPQEPPEQREQPPQAGPQEPPEPPEGGPPEPPEEEPPKAKTKAEKKAEKKAAKSRDELAAKDAEIAQLNDRYLRLCAEYDNFRRRSQKEKDALYADIKAETVASFLPVYDNLERALKQSTDDEAYRKGVEMIMTQFNTTLEKLGVTAVDALGQTFDPAMHNAVMHVQDESLGENQVVEVFQRGFMIGDKVIRFAMVKVAN